MSALTVVHPVAAVKRPYRQTLAEQETIFRWDREEQVVHVFSADPVVWRKLARLGLEPVKRSWLPGHVEAGRFYTLPLARFRWSCRSEAQAEASRQRGRQQAVEGRLGFRKPRLARLPTPSDQGAKG